MKKITSILTAFLMTCALATTALAGDKAINDKCPLSGKDINASKTVDYKVEFCCNNCKGKFEKNPAKFMTKAAKAEKGKCILSGKDAAESATIKVAFCCGNCQGKFEKDPQKYIGKVKKSGT